MKVRIQTMIAGAITLLSVAANGVAPRVIAQTLKAPTGADHQPESSNVQHVAPAMPRADAGRTGVYQTKPISELGGVKWISPELFTMVRKRQSMVFGDGYVTDWTWRTGFRYSAPIVADNTLFFQLYLGDSYLMALDAITGQVKWRAKRPDGYFTPPVIAGDTLFVGTNNTFLALDLKTQSDKWRYTLDAKTSAVTVPLVSDGVAYFGASDNTFYAFGAESGKLNWKFTAQAKGRLTSPVLSSGTLFFGDHTFLYAINVETGRERWKVETKKKAGALSVLDGVVYFLDTDNAINAVRSETGAHLPQSRKGEKAYTALALHHKTIYFGGKEWNVYAVDDETRKTKWKFETQAPCREPVVAGNVLYASCIDGYLYALQPATGKMLWKHEATNKYISAPVVANANVYYLCDDGHVYALQ